MPENKLLITEIRCGNRLAFTRCYDQYHRGVYAFAMRYTHDTTAAADVVQHTFMKLWESRSSLDEKHNLLNFVYTIAKNYTLNLLRAHSNAADGNRRYYQEYVEAQPAQSPDTTDAEVIEQLFNAVRELSPQKQEIFRMKLQEGLSNQEVADRLGIAVNTVKVQYTRALKQLRESVRTKYDIKE